MRDDGIGGDVVLVGYLLVQQPFGYSYEDLLLPLGEGFALLFGGTTLTVGAAVLQHFEHGTQYLLLDGCMPLEVILQSTYQIQRLHPESGVAALWQ